MASPRTIGVGLVGYGQMGRIHTLAYRTIPLYYEPAPLIPKLVGVCDNNKERAEVGRVQGGYEFACDDAMKLIERKDIDLICVCTPNKLHYPVVKAALEAGKHIFCEKPLGFDLKESEELAALETKSKGKHMVNAEFRYVNAVMMAKDLLRQGRVGRIFHFRGGHLHSGYVDPKKPREWRLVKSLIGGGVLTDLGPHILDMMLHLCGPVTEVCATMETFFKERPMPDDPTKMGKVDVEDAIGVLARFKDGGGIGYAEMSRVSTGHEDEFRVEVHGAGGGFGFRSMDPNWLRWFDGKNPKNEQGFKAIGTVQKYPPPSVMPAGKFTVGFERFHITAQYHLLKAIAEDGPVSPSFQESLRTHRLMEACYQSVERKGWVAVPE